jgi:hypothetical protein
MKRSRRAGRITAVALVVATTCGVCAFFGIDAVDIAIVGVVIIAVGLLWMLHDPAVNAADDWPPPPAVDIYGVRRDAMQLAWSLRASADAMSDDIVERVRLLIEARLAENGLDARRPGDSARIVQLGGPTVLRLARGDWPANTGVLLNALAAIERIPHRHGRISATGSPLQNGSTPSRSDPAR